MIDFGNVINKRGPSAQDGSINAMFCHCVEIYNGTTANFVSDQTHPGPSCTLCGAAMAFKCLSCGSTPNPTEPDPRDERLRELPAIKHEAGRAVQAECLKHGMSPIEAFGHGKYQEGWQTAHDPRECGHPLACWQDRNYPQSEQNYNPETRSGDPPMDYRCVICAAEAERDRLLEALRNIIFIARSSVMYFNSSSAHRAMNEINAAESVLSAYDKAAEN